jgi:6-phospho-beta-glucosidase
MRPWTDQLKVTIIGATSQSTPALFRALAESPVLSHMRFSLAARNPDRLNAIVRAICIVGGGSFALDCHDCSKTSLSAAIDGASVIVIQVRYGGLEGREFDEKFPLAFGICGDEGLGPGGLSAAWRAWPELDRLLGLVQRVNPDSRVLLLTSPGSLLTRLANLSWPALRLMGFCELPWTTLWHAAFPQLSCHGNASYDYFGINHLGWIYGLQGHDPIPLKYWRLHCERDYVIAEQMGRPESRAAELRRFTNIALRTYATGTREQINAAINLRHAPWYSHALAPLLESLITRTSCFHFFFSRPNNGWNAAFADDDVLEIPHQWSDDKIISRPARMSPPTELVACLRPFVDYERAAAQAILSQQPSGIESALQCHPWVSSPIQAAGLAQQLLRQPRRY